MPEALLSREQYVYRVLEAYQRTPGTSGQVRPPDRQLALQLQQRGIPLAEPHLFTGLPARKLRR